MTPKSVAFLSIFVASGFLLLGFNNCGDVSFKEANDQSSTLNPSGSQSDHHHDHDHHGEDEIPISDDMSRDLLDQLPEEERDIYRPISDINNNPELQEIYSCGSNSILICHFPANVESAHSLCVGFNAARSHMSHEAEISDSGELITLSDYLGPCKHSRM